ncbi:metallophosphoesterase [Thermosynechococcaceae cyanobacterium BACA0444]|uniref:Metallophosphoesterase n=1 Tax=Pseudocalidococcus azoricus BACA0444 TaxID=2918990 RepID=A0AAE4FWY6_9CYAN|nr:metallophosphoesterase [Pseudocalidococcus azoricus]MDS3862491.1 metallophosphoesterase [Pseudocalidococcus azoricus BACA0444]
MPLKRRDFLAFGAGLTLGPLLAWMQKQGAVAANSPQVPLLRFVAVADTGTGAAGQYEVANAMLAWYKLNPFSLVTLAGDNIYNDGEMEKIGPNFEKPYQGLLQAGVKFYACLGNHDIRTHNGEGQIRYPGFNMGGRYYTFTQGPVQFFALDTNRGNHWDAQLAWLKEQLSKSRAAWKVVFGHHPIYSSGIYGTNPAMVEQFAPLFEKYRVQLYINGHEHDYERSHPIKGTTYLTVGAGAGIRPVDRSGWTAYSASRLSFASLDVMANQLIIHTVGTDGQVFDQGVIERVS